MSIILFALCAIVIFIFGKKLNYYGELIGDKTGLGREWIGLVLMSSVTSLPELFVGISSSYLVGSADLAIGDILGSCAFNLGLLSLLDVFTPKNKPLLSNVSNNQVLAATLGIILISQVGLGLVLKVGTNILPSIGIFSILSAIIYFISVKILYEYNRKLERNTHANGAHSVTNLKLRTIVIRYIINAIIIIVAAIFLPNLSDKIAEEYGLGRTFMGTLFLAISTSLPEVAVSLAAIKSGSINLAVGNLLGSNIFNVFILFLDDVFYRKGELLRDASSINVVTVFNVILMSAVVIIGLMYKTTSKKYRFLMATDTLIIFIIFLINTILIYKFGNN